VVTVSAHKAYVTRWAPAASDLLVIDPTAATVLAHVDLRAQASRGDADRPIFAMPDRGLFAGGKAYVSLNELSDDFKAAGPGRVVVIDPATDAVSTLDLPDLQNCGTLAALDSAHALAVGCAGLFAAGARQIDASGVGWIDLGATPPALSVVPASGFGAAISSADLAVLGPGLAFTVVPGDFTTMRADALWGFDFAGGPPHKVLDGSGPFALGGLVADAGSKKLFIGDAADQDPHIVLIDAALSAVERTTSVAGLPPRSLAFY
jgi:hypothetical protein